MIGKAISHYTIEIKLGEGGMGAVYLTRDTRLGRKKAIKMLSPAVAGVPSRAPRSEDLAGAGRRITSASTRRPVASRPLLPQGSRRGDPRVMRGVRRLRE